METQTLTRKQQSIVQKADQIASRLAQDVGCEYAYVSLASGERLFSFGLAGDYESDSSLRRHKIEDTVCGVTIAKNELLAVENAKEEPLLSKLNYVENGGIVGYLGVPIRDAAASPIGAICGVSPSPKKWCREDVLNLRLACSEVEKLLATETLNNQIGDYSGAVLEYDDVLLALANNLNLLASVHSSSGDLLFATNGLLQVFESRTLEKAVCSQCLQTEERQFESLAENVDMPPTRVSFEGLQLRTRAGLEESWVADVQQSNGSMQFITWTRSQNG